MWGWDNRSTEPPNDRRVSICNLALFRYEYFPFLIMSYTGRNFPYGIENPMKLFFSYSITTWQSYLRKSFKLTPKTDSPPTTMEDIVLWFAKFVVPSSLYAHWKRMLLLSRMPIIIAELSMWRWDCPCYTRNYARTIRYTRMIKRIIRVSRGFCLSKVTVNENPFTLLDYIYLHEATVRFK